MREAWLESLGAAVSGTERAADRDAVATRLVRALARARVRVAECPHVEDTIDVVLAEV